MESVCAAAEHDGPEAAAVACLFTCGSVLMRLTMLCAPWVLYRMLRAAYCVLCAAVHMLLSCPLPRTIWTMRRCHWL